MPLAGSGRIVIVITISDVGLRAGKRRSKHRERVSGDAGSGLKRRDVRNARIPAQVRQQLGEASLPWLDNFKARRPKALPFETLECRRNIFV